MDVMLELYKREYNGNYNHDIGVFLRVVAF